ncbi:hypothetical protein ATN88_07550 [Enterovibrio coralii]|uniref:Aminotransferase class V domain-containing protein n=1 Tax=Enterovibrio coralii TaxID=294935 RepID=A0A135I519_9GAMM|nr:hypothetical protein ATN88_07550 [Enterovibrio coralii]
MEKFRQEFPILNGEQPILYFDNAATSLKPEVVVRTVCDFYHSHTANIHRGAHSLSEITSSKYEDVRSTIARYYDVLPKEIVFTYGVTHGANLLAKSLHLTKNDTVIASELEHHSNILPWTDAEVVLCPIDDNGLIDLNKLRDLLQKKRVRLVAIQQASNVTGVVQPIKQISELVHEYNALLVIDAAQSAPHLLPGPGDIDCDVYLVSGHKMLAPSGTGFMFIKQSVIENLDVGYLGGGAINRVNGVNYELRPAPWRFESGTPNIEGVLGLGAAFNMLTEIKDSGKLYLEQLGGYLEEKLSAIPGVIPIGIDNPDRIKTIFSFTLAKDTVDIDQFAKLLSTTESIMCRSGSLCAHPFFDKVDSKGAIRISAYLYNTKAEIDIMARVIKRLSTFLMG